MGQGNGVGYLNGKDESIRRCLLVCSDHRVFWQDHRTGAKQRPEPLIDLHRLVLPGIFTQIVDGTGLGIDQPAPGIMLPATRTDVNKGIHV